MLFVDPTFHITLKKVIKFTLNVTFSQSTHNLTLLSSFHSQRILSILLIKVPNKLHKVLNNSIIQGQEYKKFFLMNRRLLPEKFLIYISIFSMSYFSRYLEKTIGQVGDADQYLTSQR